MQGRTWFPGELPICPSPSWFPGSAEPSPATAQQWGPTGHTCKPTVSSCSWGFVFLGLFFLIVNLILPFMFIPDFCVLPPAGGRPTSHTHTCESASHRWGCQAGCWQRSVHPNTQLVFSSAFSFTLPCASLCCCDASLHHLTPVSNSSPRVCLAAFASQTSPMADVWWHY